MVTTTNVSTTRTGVRTPARIWLTILGFVLLAVAILGMFSGAANLLHGLSMHIEGGEMALHWILALVTLGLAFGLKDDALLATLTIVYGAVYLVVGLLGFFVSDLGFWHVGTGDNILHLALGVITVAAGMASRRPNLATRGYETEAQTERIGMSRRR